MREWITGPETTNQELPPCNALLEAVIHGSDCSAAAAPEDVYTAIRKALSGLREALDVDVVALLEVVPPSALDHEVTCAVQRSGRPYQPRTRFGPDTDPFGWLSEKLWEHDSASFDSLEQVPPEAPDRLVYQEMGVTAAAAATVFSGQRRLGILSAANFGAEHRWTWCEMGVLRLMAQVLGTAIVRSRSRARTDELYERLKALTTREHQVLLLVVDGMTSRSIADELGVTDRTVKAHRAAIMEKMQARSVADLVRMATRLGLIDAAQT